MMAHLAEILCTVFIAYLGLMHKRLFLFDYSNSLYLLTFWSMTLLQTVKTSLHCLILYSVTSFMASLSLLIM